MQFRSMRLIPLLLLPAFFWAGCGGGKPVTVAPAEPLEEIPIPQPVPPETGTTAAGRLAIDLPPAGVPSLTAPCANRLNGLQYQEDPTQRAALYAGALSPVPPVSEAACLAPIAVFYAEKETDPLARAAASLLAAGLTADPADEQRFLDSQPASAAAYQSFGLRPDVYELMQDRLLGLAAGGSVPAMSKLLLSQYFRDARLSDRLMPYLPRLANQQPAAFFTALRSLAGSGATFTLSALKNRDLAAFKTYLRGVNGEAGEIARGYLARLSGGAK